MYQNEPANWQKVEVEQKLLTLLEKHTRSTRLAAKSWKGARVYQIGIATE